MTFFEEMRTKYESDQKAGKFRGLAETRILIQSEAGRGWVEIRENTISADAIALLKQEGFTITTITHTDGHQWDSYKVTYYRIEWTR